MHSIHSSLCPKTGAARLSGSSNTKRPGAMLRVSTSLLTDSPAWLGCRRSPNPAADPRSVGSWSAHPVQPPPQQWQRPQLQQLPVLQAVPATAAALHPLLQWATEPVLRDGKQHWPLTSPLRHRGSGVKAGSAPAGMRICCLQTSRPGWAACVKSTPSIIAAPRTDTQLLQLSAGQPCHLLPQTSGHGL